MPAALFGVLWEELTDVMGSAATAALVRRAAKQAATRAADVDGLTVSKADFEYRYTVPPSWVAHTEGNMRALREVVSQLQPLLVELTGSVVLSRLRANRQLWQCGLFAETKES
jgi:hypothetical protein